MSAPLPSNAETAQASQAGLLVLLSQDVAQAWQELNPRDMKRSLPTFQAVMAALVRRYGTASGTLAANFYRQQRQSAGITGRVTPAIADPPPIPQVTDSVGWATQDLWTITPTTEPAAAQELISTARDKLEASSENLVQQVGRSTIIDTAQQDRAAKGWARIPEPSRSKSGTCAFCAMLSIRGITYKSKQAAAFHAHDGCQCHPEPVFTAYEPSAQVRQWQADWKTVTHRRSGKDARAAFRQHIEGRPVTGLSK